MFYMRLHRPMLSFTGKYKLSEIHTLVHSSGPCSLKNSQKILQIFIDFGLGSGQTTFLHYRGAKHDTSYYEICVNGCSHSTITSAVQQSIRIYVESVAIRLDAAIASLSCRPRVPMKPSVTVLEGLNH